MADWDANAYDRFARARQRAAADLVNAVPALDAGRIVDLGCGSGLSTELLHERWPDAEIIAVDRSPGMLLRARERVPGARFIESDIDRTGRWCPDPAPDLLFANASLHWLGNHETLLPRLLRCLQPGGVLAVQMPVNLDEPSHRLMGDTAALPAYHRYTADLPDARPALPGAEDYHDILAPHAATLDIWITRYLHPFANAREICDLFATTGLKPVLDALPEPSRQAYMDDYVSALSDAYPPRSDGRVLLALPRVFIMATRH